MTKVLTGILMLLWPILGTSAGSDYFYNSVLPPAEDRTTEKPLATPADCLEPSGSQSQGITNQGYRTIAFEVGGVSSCGGNQHSGQGSTYWVWTYTYNPGSRVKVRYGTRNTTDPFYTCSSSDPMFLWLKAPGMGIDERYLNSGGGWSLIPTYFRNNSPSKDVWNDLYNDVPPAGDYRLVIGCDSSPNLYPPIKGGEIRFKIRAQP